MIERRYRIPLLAAALAHILMKLQWAHPIAWDEVEFFRATKWISEGRVPFRDFWEHHLPLQWLLFAPVAAFIDDPGTAAIVVMRWAQAVLWIATFVVLFRIMRDAEIDWDAAFVATLALLAAPLFVGPALEYRVDVPAGLAYLGALAVVFRWPRARTAWIAFGVLMSAAVLANLRVAYLVAGTGILVPFVDRQERRWRWNPASLWMVAGIVIAALPFIAWLMGTGAFPAFVEAMRLNVMLDRVLASRAETLVPLLLRPFTTFDAAATAVLIGGLAGAIVVLRDIRRPAALQVMALLAMLSLFSVAMLGVHYPYHLQLTCLLFVPLLASILQGAIVRRVSMVVVAVIMAVNLASLALPAAFVPMRYQNTVMTEADLRTPANQKIFDGVGFALRREPAYRYWFLPSIVRIAAERGMIAPYAANEMIEAPPAAIIHSFRVHLWLRQFPSAAAYATRHYVPLYRDLWLPGLSANVAPAQRVTWIAPRAGRYRLVASDLLPKHPWFFNPLNYAMVAGSDNTAYEVELQRLPAADRNALRLIVDGAVVTTPLLELRKGSIVSLQSALSHRVGVLIVPHDVTTLFISPDVPVMM